MIRGREAGWMDRSMDGWTDGWTDATYLPYTSIYVIRTRQDRKEDSIG